MPVSLTVPLQAFVATIISDYELKMRAGAIFGGCVGSPLDNKNYDFLNFCALNGLF